MGRLILRSPAGRRAGRPWLIPVVRWGVASLAIGGIAGGYAQSRPAGRPERAATVTWTADTAVAAQNIGQAVINLRGSIRDGWHVYALKQSANGPTPLVVAIDRNDIARAGGPPKSDAPIVAFEPAFGFATPYHARTVTVNVPVRFNQRPGPGRYPVPLSVRYQSCDGRICEPPKTIHLTAQIDVRARG